jgi:hypothetical protein
MLAIGYAQRDNIIMSSFETQLDRVILETKRAAQQTAEESAAARADELKTLAIQQHTGIQMRELQEQIFQIVSQDIGIGFRKLKQLGAIPDKRIKTGSVANSRQFNFLDGLLRRADRQRNISDNYEMFWIIGGYILSHDQKPIYRAPNDYTNLGDSGGSYRETTGSCILLSDDGSILCTVGVAELYGVKPVGVSDTWPGVFTGTKPKLASVIDLVPSVLFTVDPVQNPGAYTDLTKIAPVTTFRNALTQLVAKAAGSESQSN